MIGANEYYLNQYLDRQDRGEARYPVCEKCHATIYDEYYFEIDGEILCEECVNDKYRQETDEYVLNHY